MCLRCVGSVSGACGACAGRAFGACFACSLLGCGVGRYLGGGVLARINLLTLKRHVGTDSLKACWCYYEMSLALPCTGFKFK